MNFQGASTTTTTKVTETHVQTNIRWDPGYVKTIPGILKVAQIVVSIVGFICIMCAPAWWRAHSSGNWFSFVSMTAFWTTGTLLLFYLLHVIEKFHVIPWLLIETVFCTLWTFFYMTTAIDTAVKANHAGAAFGAASFFGFVGMALYGYDAFIKLQGYRAGQLAQGQRTVQQSTTSQVQSPAY